MSKPKGYDFCGWVTKNDIPCSDGRVINRDAFAHQDGMKVPMVYMHNQRDASQLVGYTILENRPEGVYGYSYCNATDNGKNIKEAVRHGDVNAYSIYADGLKEKARKVMHGMIKEVSVVLSGANKGATIEEVSFAHYDSDDNIEYDAIIVQDDSGMEFDSELSHADTSDKEETEENDMADDKTVEEIIETLNDDQKLAVGFLIEMAKRKAVKSPESEDDEEEEETVKHYDYEGEEDMKTNVFDMDGTVTGGVLSHSDIENIFTEAKRGNKGTLKDVYTEYTNALAHSDEDYGITRSEDVQDYFVNDPSFLFPEARELNNTPDFIKRPTDWVSVVMNGVHHTPFSRVKTTFADITADEARAKGYIKGDRKEEEVFTLLRRVTEPQTIYKIQKLDRDDMIDITDFDKVAWLKGEMRMMLDEEIARAILIGDGRSTADRAKIKETNVRPVWNDADLFTIKKTVDVSNPKNIITAAVRARKDYRGSGNPIMFTTEDYLTDMLLLEDQIGRPLYETEAALATKMRVSKIVTVPVMENVMNSDNKTPVAVILNLNDYNVGADKGGAVNLFEDFDINFNQMEYLIETRISGALIKPFSAIVLEANASNPSQG